MLRPIIRQRSSLFTGRERIGQRDERIDAFLDDALFLLALEMSVVVAIAETALEASFKRMADSHLLEGHFVHHENISRHERHWQLVGCDEEVATPRPCVVTSGLNRVSAFSCFSCVDFICGSLIYPVSKE